MKRFIHKLINLDSKSRVKNSFRNVGIGLFGRFLVIPIRILLRTVFIYVLGKELLGVNNLFTSILTMISLSELGFQATISFALYKPVAENNINKISVLMKLYRKAYICIGFFVLIVGFFITPFLDFFIKISGDISNLKLIYVLFVINTGISYFFVYKSTLFSAYQKNYVVTSINTICQITIGILQIITLLVFKNYILYLVLNIVCTLIQNLILYLLSSYEYSNVDYNTNGILPKDEKITLFKLLMANSFCRLSYNVSNSIDNIIYSKYFGLGTVAVISNFYMIFNFVSGFIDFIYTGIIASVGNAQNVKDKKENFQLFQNIFYMYFVIYGILTVVLVNMVQNLVYLWLGNDYGTDFVIVIFIAYNFFLKGVHSAPELYVNVCGLQYDIKFCVLLEMISNIVFSILLAKFFGPVGVVMGTVVSYYIGNFIFYPSIVFKKVFNQLPISYYFMHIKYLILTIIATAISYFWCNSINYGFLSLILEFFISCFIAVLLFFIFTFNSNEFKFFLNLFERSYKSKKK